jgi:hypothetical protein
VAGVSEASEEFLASVLGAMICHEDTGRVVLLAKAAAELQDRGQSAEDATRQLQQLCDLLGALLWSEPRKLRTIRQEIERALATSSADPIPSQERLLASAERKRDSTEVLQGLKRFLSSSAKPKHRRRRVEARKGKE